MISTPMVPSKADIVSNLSKGGCVNLRTRAGVGQKIRYVCGRPKWKPPRVAAGVSKSEDEGQLLLGGLRRPSFIKALFVFAAHK